MIIQTILHAPETVEYWIGFAVCIAGQVVYCYTAKWRHRRKIIKQVMEIGEWR